MYQIIFHLLLAFSATTAGAVTGMGGGVIIKPVLDATGLLDALTINMLSSFTVLSMAIVSVIKHVTNKVNIDFKTAIALSIGSVAGGWLGGGAIQRLIDTGGSMSFIIQNTALFLITICVFYYMRKKDQFQNRKLSGAPVSLAVGVSLGALTAFLGIGGGPINVALIIYLFSYSTKQAAVSSVIVILFSQVTKVSGILLAGNLAQYDFSLLPPMVIGAIAGGLTGSHLQAKLSEKGVVKAFQAIQILVLLICVLNIVKYMNLSS